jgi:hypothetical protein
MCKFTEAEVQQFPLLHSFRNEWRQRHVAIHEHPTDPTKVVTMGYSLAASGGITTIPPVICVEDKAAYKQILDRKITRYE